MQGPTALFFDVSCVSNLKLDVVDDPLACLDRFMEAVFMELRLDSFTENIVTFVAMMMLLQLGGIPVARDIIGRVLWLLHIGTLTFQFLLAVLAVLQVFVALAVVQKLYGECMVQGPFGFAMFPVAVLPTFLFQPIILFKFALAYIYLQAAIVDIVVLAGTCKGLKNWKGQGCLRRLMQCPCVPEPIDKVLTEEIAFGFLLVSFPSILCWVISGAFMFSLIVFFPMAIVCMGVTICVHAMVWAAGVLVSKCCHGQRVRSFDSMNWVQLILNLSLMLSYGPLAAAAYGPLAAGFINSGDAHLTINEPLEFFYKTTFDIFSDMHFSLTMLSFDMDVRDVLRHLGDVYRLMDFDPGHFVNASHALSVLGFLVANVKILVSGMTSARIMVGNSKAASVPFHVAAQWSLKNADFSEEVTKYLEKAAPNTCDGLTKPSELEASPSTCDEPTKPGHQERCADSAMTCALGRSCDARMTEAIGAKTMLSVGDAVWFIRSDGTSVLARLVEIDEDAQTCDLEYNGVMLGQFRKLRKRFVGLPRLGVVYERCVLCS